MVILLFVFLGLMSGCSMSSSDRNQSERPLVESDYLLKQDRQAFDQLRAEVSDEKKVENDELAFMDQMFSNPLKNTADIRNQFNRALNKKKDKFNKDLKKKREDFVKIERKDRDEFVKSLAQERENFKQKKVDKEKTKEFYDELDLKRKDFFADQKEKRELFEGQVRDDRNNFADYTKEKQTEFNSRLKTFTEQQKLIKK